MMKYLIIYILFILFIPELFVRAQPVAANCDRDDNQQKLSWIQSVLKEQDTSIHMNDYILYTTGHHGIIWSLVASDSSSMYLHNGTTRPYMEKVDCILPDTMSFIKDNRKTISWGFDSLPKAAHLIVTSENQPYNPIYAQLYIIRDIQKIAN